MRTFDAEYLIPRRNITEYHRLRSKPLPIELEDEYKIKFGETTPFEDKFFIWLNSKNIQKILSTIEGFSDSKKHLNIIVPQEELNVKRLRFTTGFNHTCTKCGYDFYYNFDDHYFSYPIVNKWQKKNISCFRCGNEDEIEFRLNISIDIKI